MSHRPTLSGSAPLILMLIFVLGAGACGPDYSERAAAIDDLVGESIAGAAVYETSCQECHEMGTMGAPDFREGGDEHEHTDAEYIETILAGLLIRMPAFADELSDEQVADVLAHVRVLESAPAE